MGIEINLENISTTEILVAFGIGTNAIDKLSGGGVEIQMTTTGLKFVKDVHGAKQYLSSVSIKTGAVSLALKGELGPASTQAIGYKLSKAINTALAKVEKIVDKIEVEAEDIQAEAEMESSAFKEIGEMKLEDLSEDVMKKAAESLQSEVDKAAADVLEMAEEIEKTKASVSEFQSGKPLKLEDANLMYQPVKGSSTKSIYHVVAMTTDLRIAARYQGGSLSIRAEGNLDKFKERLKEGGFSMGNIGKGYVSVHLTIADQLLAKRTLSAILAGMGVAFATPIPVLDTIIGKGA